MSSDHEIEPAIKPPYLSLLNAISIASAMPGVLKAWADVTPDPELRRALSLVAAREMTHGDVFRQRIERLGFSLLDKDDDPELVERLRVLGDPPRSNAEGRSRRESGRGGRVDAFCASLDEVADESVERSRGHVPLVVHGGPTASPFCAAYAQAAEKGPSASLPPSAAGST